MPLWALVREARRRGGMYGGSYDPDILGSFAFRNPYRTFPSRFGWWPNATDHITWERVQGQASAMLMSLGSDSRPLPSGAGDFAA